VRRDGAPRVWYICLGNPEYNNPLHSEKAIKQKKFAYQEFDSSAKDKLLARELRVKAKEILLSNATARIMKAKDSKEKDEARDKVLQGGTPTTRLFLLVCAAMNQQPATTESRDTGRCYSPSSL
jgi:hypothetical protein